MDEIQTEKDNLIELKENFKSLKDGWVAARKLEHTDYVQSVKFNFRGRDSETEIFKPKPRIITLKEKIMIIVYKAINRNKLLNSLYIKYKNGFKKTQQEYAPIRKLPNGERRIGSVRQDILLNNPLNKFKISTFKRKTNERTHRNN
jgi:hypothetical protein